MSAVRRRRAATVWLLTLALTGVAALTGCGSLAGAQPAVAAGVRPTPTKTVGPDTYERSGRTGNERLVLPPAGTPTPYPLVVALHSLYHGGTETQTWGLEQLARTAGFAMVSPTGIGSSWNAGTCCAPAASTNADDVAWLRALIQHLETNYPIDPSRVVLVGLSNGAMMAYRYACQYPQELAGIAVVAGSLQQPGCAPRAPVTVVSIHGGLDDHVPDAGISWQPSLATGITSTAQSLAPFRAVNECAAVTSSDVFATGPDGAPRVSENVSAGTAAVTPAQLRAGKGGGLLLTPVNPVISPPDATRTETSCASGARVVEYFLPKLGHGWPPISGSAAFDTSHILWGLLSEARARSAAPAR